MLGGVPPATRPLPPLLVRAAARRSTRSGTCAAANAGAPAAGRPPAVGQTCGPTRSPDRGSARTGQPARAATRAETSAGVPPRHPSQRRSRPRRVPRIARREARRSPPARGVGTAGTDTGPEGCPSGPAARLDERTARRGEGLTKRPGSGARGRQAARAPLAAPRPPSARHHLPAPGRSAGASTSYRPIARRRRRGRPGRWSGRRRCHAARAGGRPCHEQRHTAVPRLQHGGMQMRRRRAPTCSRPRRAGPARGPCPRAKKAGGALGRGGGGDVDPRGSVVRASASGAFREPGGDAGLGDPGPPPTC